MKKLLILALILIPATSYADRLGGLKASSNVLLSTQSAGASLPLLPGDTNYIQNTNSVQQATFTVMRGVTSELEVGSNSRQNSPSEIVILPNAYDNCSIQMNSSGNNFFISNTGLGELNFGVGGLSALAVGSDGHVNIYDTAGGGGKLSLYATSVAGTVSFRLPSLDGSSGQCIKTNGSGVLSFGSGVTGSTTSITISYNGGGSAIAAGVESSTACTVIPFGLTLSSWTVISPPPSVSGSISVTIRKAAVATPTTFAAMSAGGNPPAMTSAVRNDGAPTSWTSTAITAGDMVCGEVTSATSVTRAVVTLWGYR